MIAREDITGLILAGGRGSRMGGADKGLQVVNGMPLALHALWRLQSQVGEVMINANRNLAAYEAFGAPVWPDALADYAGPLAGFLCGLEHCETPWLLSVPCDSPNFPLDLAQRLSQAVSEKHADIAIACTDEAGVLQRQPVFCLMKASLLESLVRYTQGGGRKIDAWVRQHPHADVVFEDSAAFFNANTLEDLRGL